jgi:hypothetical protein
VEHVLVGIFCAHGRSDERASAIFVASDIADLYAASLGLNAKRFELSGVLAPVAPRKYLLRIVSTSCVRVLAARRCAVAQFVAQT